MLQKIATGKYALLVNVAGFSLLLSAFTRLLLVFSVPLATLNFGQIAGSFLIGMLYDITITSVIVFPFLLHLWWQNNRIYEKKYFPFICIFFVLVLAVLLFTSLVPKDFSPPLYKGLIGYLVLRLIIYVSLFYAPAKFRSWWRKVVLGFSLSIVVSLLLFNAVSEWFFWQEFSSRYNFIAVDYLIYTTEVLGNIKESYPIAFILTIISLATLATVYFSRKQIVKSVGSKMTFAKRSVLAAAIIAFTSLALVSVKEEWRHFSKNEYANALAGNGMFEFVKAFQQNELDFYKYYRTIPDSTAFAIVRQNLSNANTHFVNTGDPFSIERDIHYAEPEQKLNLVLISVESLSADFMHAFGNTAGITPFLDSLANRSLFFTNLYASGTRTVRGLEALSLSLPPTPGQSIVKRPNNAGMFSLGSVFKSKGYTTQYIYGGYSYFDNMKDFFGNNDYQVIDRSSIPAAGIHYQNIWGVADEDLFTLVQKNLDSNASQHKPFFAHVMTVSNHRPYTYPENRIDISPTTQTRDGAVKYTDYAIRKFIQESSTKPWFDKTIFVIVADHCAGSAGSAELPVNGYHIPMMIYAPKLLAPKKIETLTAQIDIAPTILGLLKFDYRSKFFGQDVLNTATADQHAFISTYQGLGFLKGGQLLTQSPLKKVKQASYNLASGDQVAGVVDEKFADEAIAYYQCASWLLRHGKQYN